MTTRGRQHLSQVWRAKGAPSTQPGAGETHPAWCPTGSREEGGTLLETVGTEGVLNIPLDLSHSEEGLWGDRNGNPAGRQEQRAARWSHPRQERHLCSECGAAPTQPAVDACYWTGRGLSGWCPALSGVTSRKDQFPQAPPLGPTAAKALGARSPGLWGQCWCGALCWESPLIWSKGQNQESSLWGDITGVQTCAPARGPGFHPQHFRLSRVAGKQRKWGGPGDDTSG